MDDSYPSSDYNAGFILREPYGKGFRAMEIKFGKPCGWGQWRRALWGTDIWIGPLPFLKTSVTVNMLAWIVALVAT